jgi:exosome complex RNA-binding protein Csl4
LGLEIEQVTERENRREHEKKTADRKGYAAWLDTGNISVDSRGRIVSVRPEEKNT